VNFKNIYPLTTRETRKTVIPPEGFRDRESFPEAVGKIPAIPYKPGQASRNDNLTSKRLHSWTDSILEYYQKFMYSSIITLFLTEFMLLLT